MTDLVPGDAHRYFVDIDDGGCNLRVVCPYPRDDQERPCWPQRENTGGDADAFPWVPEDPPQTMCTHSDWVENTMFDEIAHGSTSVELEHARFDWSNGDYPVVQVGGEAQ